MYVSNFRNFPTFSTGMCSNQSTNRMVTNYNQTKLTIRHVKTIFNVNMGNVIKSFDAGG